MKKLDSHREGHATLEPGEALGLDIPMDAHTVLVIARGLGTPDVTFAIVATEAPGKAESTQADKIARLREFAKAILKKFPED